MDRLDTGNPSMFSRRTLGDREYYSSLASLIFVLATQAQTIAMALLRDVQPRSRSGPGPVQSVQERERWTDQTGPIRQMYWTETDRS